MQKSQSRKFVAYDPKARCPRCARIKDYIPEGVTLTYCEPWNFRRAGCKIETTDHVHVECRDCGMEWVMHPKPAVPYYL